jgi:protein-disulfide isomerase
LFTRFFSVSCAVTIAAACCAAQQNTPNPATPATAADPAAAAASATPAAAAPVAVPALERKIEIMIRSELGVPPQYEIAIGPRQKSDLNGYDTIAVTFSLPSQPQKKQTVEFLLSKDSSTLARLSKWDIGPDPGTTLPTDGRPVRGNPDAKVTIVNFDDLECPYCARMNAEFFPETLDRYKGLVKFVYLDYPLVEIHPWAMHAAVERELPCGAEPGGVLELRRLSAHARAGCERSGQQSDKVGGDAGQTGGSGGGAKEQLDAAKLDACLAKQDDSKIVAEMRAADKVGVNATPTFFVSGERWAGQLEAHQLWIMIDRALTEQGIAPRFRRSLRRARRRQRSRGSEPMQSGGWAFILKGKRRPRFVAPQSGEIFDLSIGSISIGSIQRVGR